MKYRGFYIKITPDDKVTREDKYGNEVRCKGFQIEVFSDESESLELDVFFAGVGFEISTDSEFEVEQFVKDVVDSEEKEYKRSVDS